MWVRVCVVIGRSIVIILCPCLQPIILIFVVLDHYVDYYAHGRRFDNQINHLHCIALYCIVTVSVLCHVLTVSRADLQCVVVVFLCHFHLPFGFQNNNRLLTECQTNEYLDIIYYTVLQYRKYL